LDVEIKGFVSGGAKAWIIQGAAEASLSVKQSYSR